MLRGSGATSDQMRGAPDGAVFVWCNDQLVYARSLARHLNRRDLRVVSPRDLEEGAQIFRGCKISAVIIDHAARLTDDQRYGLALITGREAR